MKKFWDSQMKKLVIIIGVIFFSAFTAYGQKSPSETVIKFYRALKDKKYVEGFHVSVYRGAIEGLSPAELKELEPDFARTFSEIPDKIDVRGVPIKEALFDFEAFWKNQMPKEKA